MIRLLTIIGARPQIIKSAAFSRAIKNRFSTQVEERILHTGQHYDENMSQVFFTELGIPQPSYNLCVGSDTHGAQTAKMIEGIERILTQEKFDGVVVFGDTNSTLAGTLAATKLEVPVFHIEAGLRSFNMSMPEEQNRIVCDQLSSILFAPTQTAINNLQTEGLITSKAVFKGKKSRVIINCGDLMYDNSVYFARIAEQKSKILSDHELTIGKFSLVTIHRNNNTDTPEKLHSIIDALLTICNEHKHTIVLPLHPRTAKIIYSQTNKTLHDRIKKEKRLKLINPLAFLDMIMLEKNANLIITDSGGVQKEAFFFEKPSIILRNETEWTEIIDHRAGILTGTDQNKICEAFSLLHDQTIEFPRLFGDGKAAEIMVKNILEYLQ